MTSYKSRMFNFLIRNSFLFQGRIKKEFFTLDTSIVEFRERCEKGAARYSKLPPDISVKEQFIEGIKSEWLIPKGADTAQVILYVHGGGYVSGSCSDHRGLISKFAWYTGVATLLFEYRLAPENPFPAALDDSVKMYKWLLGSGFHPDNIIMAGESAGGGLCLATLLALKDQKIPMPRAAVAISPWTDLTCSGGSYRTKNKLSPAPLNSWYVFSKHYAGDHDASHPYISPLFGNLEGLPPLFINAGVDDELYDDGEQFFLKAKEAGVDATFRAGTGLVHCYPLLAPMFREATEAMEEIVGFIHQQLQTASYKL
jgi:epsilon-lactone hydrolase